MLKLRNREKTEKEIPIGINSIYILLSQPFETFRIILNIMYWVRLDPAVFSFRNTINIDIFYQGLLANILE